MAKLHTFTFMNTHQANLVHAHLRHNGIEATIDGDGISTSLSYIGAAISKIRVLVHVEDAATSQELIDELLASPEEISQWGETTQWLCDHCEEENEFSFDVCWNCNTDRPESPRLCTASDEMQGRIIEEGVNPNPDLENDSPYRPPATQTVWQRFNGSLFDRFRSKYLRLTVITLALPIVGVAYVLIRLFEKKADDGTPTDHQ